MKAAFALGVALLAAASAPAWAQEAPEPGLDVQRFRPVGGAHAFVTVESARQLPALSPGVDLWFDYAHRPLQFSNPGLGRAYGVIDGLVSARVRAAFGVTDWFEVGLAVPFLRVVIPPPDGGFAHHLDPEAGRWSMGDVEIQARLRPLDEETAVGVAFVPYVTLPTGSTALHMGSGVPTLGVRAAVSKRLTRLHLAGHLGYRFKPGGAVVGGSGADDEVEFGAGVGVTPWPDRLDLNVEASGAVIVGEGRRSAAEVVDVQAVHMPIELLGSARFRTPVDVDVIVGAGGGVTPGIGSPVFRAFAGVAWSPTKSVIELDRDGDGVRIGLDACPDEAEDVDGFADHDGCPDPDNDGDGFLDDVDPCPDVAEDFDGTLDGDGCPELDDDDDGVLDPHDACPEHPEDGGGWSATDGCPAGVEVALVADLILTAHPVRLGGGAGLRPESAAMLDGVARLLAAEPSIRLLRIEVRPPRRDDLDEAAAYARVLSRAALLHLVEAGVDPDRLEAVQRPDPAPGPAEVVQLVIVRREPSPQLQTP